MKLITFRILILLTVMNAVPSLAQSYSGGSGTSGAPYQIATVADLITLSKTEAHWDKYFLQTADIIFDSDETNVDWNNDGSANWSVADQLGFTPIGRGAYGVPKQFKAQYDGGNYIIKNLYINRNESIVIGTGVYDVGMFGYLDASGKLINIHLENVDITAFNYNGSTYYSAGALVGYIGSYLNPSPLVNCSSTGVVRGKAALGGLVGKSNSGSIKNSYSLCTVINSATSGNTSTGGLVGTLQYNSAEISNSFSSGDVTSSYYSTGGLVGNFSSFSGNVCIISNSYSTSNVTGLSYVGGLIGSLGQDTNVYNTYSTGIVTATIASGPQIGGLIGYISTTNATVSNSFWDTENSGIATSNGGLGKTTAQMKVQTTFTTSAWDFSTGTNNWSIQSGSYESYPYLQTFTYDSPGAAPALNPIPGLYTQLPNPSLSSFTDQAKYYFDASYSIVPPMTNSSGAFTYSSNNLAVATISGTMVTIIGAGNAVITATQASDGSYNSGSITSGLTVNAVSVLTNTGAISSTNPNYVNQYGQIGGDFGLSANGAILNAKTPPIDGSTAARAGISALQIKTDYPSSADGVYWIINPSINSGSPFQIYADMTTDGGGWMLLNISGTSSASSLVSSVTSLTDKRYLPRATVIELANLSTDVQLRSGNSAASYANKTTSTSPLAIGALQSSANDINGAGTWANGASSTFVVNSGSWCWSYCCPGNAGGWPKMFHSSNYAGCVHWFADGGAGTGRKNSTPDAWFSTWIR